MTYAKGDTFAVTLNGQTRNVECNWFDQMEGRWLALVACDVVPLDLTTGHPPRPAFVAEPGHSYAVVTPPGLMTIYFNGNPMLVPFNGEDNGVKTATSTTWGGPPNLWKLVDGQPDVQVVLDGQIVNSPLVIREGDRFRG